MGEWSELYNGSLITFVSKGFEKPKQENTVRIVGFDFDGTLVNTKSGKSFPVNENDWELWCSSVPAKLKKYQQDGYILVIFSNQNGIVKNKLTVESLKSRMEQFMKKVGSDVKFLIFVSVKEDHFRKPAVGMWEYMEKNVLDGVNIDKANSIYVGDAAGRPKSWKKGKKKDHSCSDRKFAMNLRIKFNTPDEFFFGEKEYTNWSLDGFDIKSLQKEQKAPYEAEQLISKKQEVIIFQGFPASGKTTFYKRYFEPKDYVHVNRDLLSTSAKCLKVLDEALENGKSVVVDNTNPNASSRKQYIDAAKKHGVPVRCFIFKVDEKLAKHLNLYRENVTKGTHKHVPQVGFNIYKKNLEEPKLSEGFSEIKEIEFVPVFADEESKEKFYHYT